MRLKNIILMLSAVLLVFGGAYSDLHAEENSVKIGVIDIQKILAESSAGKDAQEKLQAKLDESLAKLKMEEDNVLKLQEDIEKKKSVWAPDVLSVKEREFNKKSQELKLELKYLQDEMKDLEQKAYAPILKEVRTATKEVCSKQGLLLVLQLNMAVYADEKIDISDAIIAELDKKK
ncbi:MAG: OmpH family outer membrane protein [Proteobacteria bacterium]|nr:OmpH family outer membrane protein [Pseudomonadota bacterium]MBU1715943.1 OmpH family outer membrane protein [Pseudomonadota bacterium]